MASRELVGRPLVPFFDSDENVNDSLAVDASASAHEQIDVDARVWDKELGYFVYPSEQSASARGSRQPNSSTSHPISIPAKGKPPRADGNKTLLTPAMMLSTSCPETSTVAADSHSASASVPVGNGGAPRSNSNKRGSRRSKDRSGTTNAQTNSSQNGAATGSSGKTESGSSKRNRNRSSSANKSQAASNGGQQKQKADASSSGKWAWSAFQSSPDPNQLPMPPFLVPSAAAEPALTVSTPPAPPLPPSPLPAVSTPAAPAPTSNHFVPHQSTPPPPFQPPLPPTPPPPESSPPMSLELSMTQDLRRMLNIGGG